MVPLKEHGSRGSSVSDDGDAVDSNKISTTRILFNFFLALLAVVFLVLLVFSGGLLTGYTVFDNSRRADECAAPVASPARPDWGDSVTANGEEDIPVVQWMDVALEGDNIRENLRLEGRCICVVYMVYNDRYIAATILHEL